jgi:hypothetical protein
MVRASMRLAVSRSAIIVCSSAWTSCATTSREIEMQAGKSAHRAPHVWFSGSLLPLWQQTRSDKPASDSNACSEESS